VDSIRDLAQTRVAHLQRQINNNQLIRALNIEHILIQVDRLRAHATC